MSYCIYLWIILIYNIALSQTDEIYTTNSSQSLTCNSLLTNNVLQYHIKQLLTHYGKDSEYKIGNPIKFGATEFFDVKINGLSDVQFTAPVDIVDLPSGDVHLIFTLLFDYLIINGQMKMPVFMRKVRPVEIKMQSTKIFLDLLLSRPMDNNKNNSKNYQPLPVSVRKVTVIHWNKLKFDSRGFFIKFFKMFNRLRIYDSVIKRSIEKEIYQQMEGSLRSFFEY
uniref:SMP-LTD domain-containing protein n=1 Tax=Trichobilharzia regenti TaxID=157069 RepID=A0AA85JK45_TRIRE|nr:unnamed protein product [Trichobilharzia regenti]